MKEAFQETKHSKNRKTRSEISRGQQDRSVYLHVLSVAPVFVQLMFLLPILGGLFGIVLPALGYFPELGGKEFSLGPFRQLLQHPSLPNALLLTIFTGCSATLISLASAMLLSAAGGRSWGFSALRKLLIPLIAMPHASLALGLAFLLAPSGWLVRLFSAWIARDGIPPQWVTIGDPWGITLILGLVLKETPYLLLMIQTMLPQCQEKEMLKTGMAMGYGPFRSWLKLVLPRVYPLIRLPVFVVLAFSLSVVDVSLILGPSTPPPLALLIVQWFHDPDLNQRFPGSAAAVLLLLIILLALAVWRLGEWIALTKRRAWLVSGRRGSAEEGKWLAAGIGTVLIFLTGFSGLGLVLWSAAWRWPFPELLPVRWSLATWIRHWQNLGETVYTSVGVGAVATAIALIMAVLCLENEKWNQVRFSNRGLWLVYLPLLVPQVSFLPGVHVLSVRLGLDGTWLLLIWSHLLFVLPYVFLSLSDAWHTLDMRYQYIASCLGKKPIKVLYSIKLRLLLRPLLVGAAIGFAVSVAQYLPTLFAGGGRFATLTTEAVGFAAGGNRRLIGVYGLLQTLFPWLALLLAMLIPRWMFRNRMAMR